MDEKQLVTLFELNYLTSNLEAIHSSMGFLREGLGMGGNSAHEAVYRELVKSVLVELGENCTSVMVGGVVSNHQKNYDLMTKDHIYFFTRQMGHRIRYAILNNPRPFEMLITGTLEQIQGVNTFIWYVLGQKERQFNLLRNYLHTVKQDCEHLMLVLKQRQEDKSWREGFIPDCVAK